MAMTIDAARTKLRRDFPAWVLDLGLIIEEIGAGQVRLRLPASDHLNRMGGVVSGQALMAMADTAMVFEALSHYDDDRDLATVTQNTSFLSAIVGADVICEAQVIKVGRRLVFGEARLYAAGSDQPAAHTTMTCAVAPPAG